MKEKYKWLKITTTVEEYVNPEYYNKILKDYIFNNQTDLEIFGDWLKNNGNSVSNVLELGCGSGRVSDIALSLLSPNTNYDMLDLSNQMLNYCKEKYKDLKNINFINSDTIEYLNLTNKTYDLVFSLWSYSHSTHQTMEREGLKKGFQTIREVLKKFINDNMKSGSKIFIIHFDSMSDEQRILIEQWKKVFPIFEDTTIQSPSLIKTSEIFEELKNDGVIKYELNHYMGKEIIYSSEEEALEIFMNFHMESYFNESDKLGEVLSELKNYFENFKNDLGQIIIKPGCFVYSLEKL